MRYGHLDVILRDLRQLLPNAGNFLQLILRHPQLGRLVRGEDQLFPRRASRWAAYAASVASRSRL